jgi:hypothetical protein
VGKMGIWFRRSIFFLPAIVGLFGFRRTAGTPFPGSWFLVHLSKSLRRAVLLIPTEASDRLWGIKGRREHAPVPRSTQLTRHAVVSSPLC